MSEYIHPFTMADVPNAATIPAKLIQSECDQNRETALKSTVTPKKKTPTKQKQPIFAPDFRARRLISPFAKVEDLERCFRPTYKEFKNNDVFKLPTPGLVKTSSCKILSGEELEEAERGYCEICKVSYKYLEQHCNSKKHQTSINAHEEEYRRIDELIQKMPSINDLTARFRIHRDTAAAMPDVDFECTERSYKQSGGPVSIIIDPDVPPQSNFVGSIAADVSAVVEQIISSVVTIDTNVNFNPQNIQSRGSCNEDKPVAKNTSINVVPISTTDIMVTDTVLKKYNAEKRKKFICPIPECGMPVINLSRHMKSKRHGWSEEKARAAISLYRLRKPYEKKKDNNNKGGNEKCKDYYQLKVCPFCMKILKRLDEHVFNHHHNKKDKEFYGIIKEATTYTPSKYLKPSHKSPKKQKLVPRITKVLFPHETSTRSLKVDGCLTTSNVAPILQERDDCFTTSNVVPILQERDDCFTTSNVAPILQEREDTGSYCVLPRKEMEHTMNLVVTDCLKSDVANPTLQKEEVTHSDGPLLHLISGDGGESCLVKMKLRRCV